MKQLGFCRFELKKKKRKKTVICRRVNTHFLLLILTGDAVDLGGFKSQSGSFLDAESDGCGSAGAGVSVGDSMEV